MQILVPTDFSACANHALNYASALASAISGKITLLHVLPIPQYDPNMPADMVSTIQKEQEKEAYTSMQVIGDSLANTTAGPIDLQIRQGHFTSELVAAITDCAADWVVMGTTGASGVKKIMGSHAYHALLRSPVPVLTVPAHAPIIMPKQILFCASLHIDEYQYLQKLIKVAEQLSANVTCLHVHPESTTPDPVKQEDFMHYFWQELKTTLTFSAQPSNDIAAAIDTFATAHKMDWIAVRPKERNFIEKLTQPRVSRKLVFQNTKPILAF